MQSHNHHALQRCRETLRHHDRIPTFYRSMHSHTRTKETDCSSWALHTLSFTLQTSETLAPYPSQNKQPYLTCYTSVQKVGQDTVSSRSYVTLGHCLHALCHPGRSIIKLWGDCTVGLHHFLLKSGSTLAAVRPAATSARIRLRLYRRTSFLLCSTAAFKALVSLQQSRSLQVGSRLLDIIDIKTVACLRKCHSPAKSCLSFLGPGRKQQHSRVKTAHGRAVSQGLCFNEPSHRSTAPPMQTSITPHVPDAINTAGTSLHQQYSISAHPQETMCTRGSGGG